MTSALHRARSASANTPEPIQHAEQLLASTLTILRDHSWPGTTAAVWRVRDARSRHLIVKHNTDPHFHNQEQHALSAWAPNLGAHAPQLVAADAEEHVLVMTVLPGEPVRDQQPDPADERHIYTEAGRLLRLLHDSAPTPALPTAVPDRVNSLTALLNDHRHLLTDDENTQAAHALDALTHLDVIASYPSHLDCTSRNLMWHPDSGHVSLCDFETARPELTGRDFNRLMSRTLHARPDLTEAFFTGHGRPPSSEELQVMTATAGADAVSALIWSLTHNHPGFATEARASLRRATRTPVP